MPRELATLINIKDFGVQAVYGRVLAYKEIRRMRAAENVVNAYRLRERSGDWATWAKENKSMNYLLELGLKLNGEYS